MICAQCSTRGRCLFARLPKEGHEDFWRHVRERTVAQGHWLERQGTTAPTLAVVKVGILQGVRQGPGGERKPIFLMGKGRLVGFTQPFGQAALYDLEAVTSTRICEVDIEAVRTLALRHEPFQQGLYQHIADFLGAMADWSHLLRQESFIARLCGALQMIAREEGSRSFRIPGHAVLAELLGARRETVVRHIALLIEQGRFTKIDRWHGVLTTPDCGERRQRPGPAAGPPAAPGAARR